MIGQKGPGRTYPGDTCWHRDENGKRDCTEPRCMTRNNTRRSTYCKAHEAERNRKQNSASKKKLAKRGTLLPRPVELELGSAWDRETGKGAGMCITPGCKSPSYNNTSRCKMCHSERKRTDPPPKENRVVMTDEGEVIQRRVSSKHPVLPYSFRNFGWKGTLSEELRNSR